MCSFYDPELYDLQIGPGSRVGVIYGALAVEGGGPVLELGCGTGDVVLAIARESVEVWGLDVSSAMLGRAQFKVEQEPERVRECVHLVEGRMEDFEIPRRFKQIFLPNDVIAHLLHPDALIRTLERCYQHLVPCGRIVMDLSRFDICYLARYSNADNGYFRFRGVFEMSNSHTMQVWERTFFDLETQILTAHFRYEKRDPQGQINNTFDRTLYLRPRRLEEVWYALEAAGFREIRTGTIAKADGEQAEMIQGKAMTASDA